MNVRKMIAIALGISLVSGITAYAGEQEATKTQLNVATELTSATLDPADDWNSWFVMR